MDASHVIGCSVLRTWHGSELTAGRCGCELVSALHEARILVICCIYCSSICDMGHIHCAFASRLACDTHSKSRMLRLLTLASLMSRLLTHTLHAGAKPLVDRRPFSPHVQQPPRRRPPPPPPPRHCICNPFRASAQHWPANRTGATLSPHLCAEPPTTHYRKAATACTQGRKLRARQDIRPLQDRPPSPWSPKEKPPILLVPTANRLHGLCE